MLLVVVHSSTPDQAGKTKRTCSQCTILQRFYLAETQLQSNCEEAQRNLETKLKLNHRAICCLFSTLPGLQGLQYSCTHRDSTDAFVNPSPRLPRGIKYSCSSAKAATLCAVHGPWSARSTMGAAWGTSV